MKNVVKLDHYYLPRELKEAIGRFVTHYNNDRLHESLDNVTPADVYYGRKEELVTQRMITQRRTLQQRKRYNLKPQHLRVAVP